MGLGIYRNLLYIAALKDFLDTHPIILLKKNHYTALWAKFIKYTNDPTKTLRFILFSKQSRARLDHFIIITYDSDVLGANIFDICANIFDICTISLAITHFRTNYTPQCISNFNYWLATKNSKSKTWWTRFNLNLLKELNASHYFPTFQFRSWYFFCMHSVV